MQLKKGWEWGVLRSYSPENKILNLLFLLCTSIASADIGDCSFPGCLKLIFSSLVSRLFITFHLMYPAVHSRDRAESLWYLTKEGVKSVLFWAASYIKLSSFSKSILLATVQNSLSTYIPYLLCTPNLDTVLVFTCSQRRQLLSFLQLTFPPFDPGGWEQIPSTHASAGTCTNLARSYMKELLYPNINTSPKAERSP